MKYGRYGYDDVRGIFTLLPLKTVQKTVRLDDNTVAVIDSMPGKNFSEKLRYLVAKYDCMTNNPDHM